LHPGELVTARLEPHQAQLLARPALMLSALGHPRAQLLKPAGKRIARALEPAEVQ